MTATPGNLITRTMSSTGTRWSRLKTAHPGLAHVVDAWAVFQERNGGQYAGAITFFSFLALFPLLLLVVAVVGFVLHAHPAAQATLFRKIETSVSGSLGSTLKTSLQSAINARAGVGLVGLAGVLLSGLGWIGNLRAAINAMWGVPRIKQSFLKVRLANLVVLGGLGLSVLGALALTVVGTSLTDQILSALGWRDAGPLHWLVKVIGIAVALVGYLLIFGWVLARLPRVAVPRWVAWRGALFAAVGFEILAVVGTYTIAKSTHSPTAGPFASLLAVLIWIKLVAQLLLYIAAWMSVLVDAAEDHPSADVGVEPSEPAPTAEAAVSPAAVAGSLLAVGAAAGASAVALANRRRQQH